MNPKASNVRACGVTRVAHQLKNKFLKAFKKSTDGLVTRSEIKLTFILLLNEGFVFYVSAGDDLEFARHIFHEERVASCELWVLLDTHHFYFPIIVLGQNTSRNTKRCLESCKAASPPSWLTSQFPRKYLPTTQERESHISLGRVYWIVRRESPAFVACLSRSHLRKLSTILLPGKPPLRLRGKRNITILSQFSHSTTLTALVRTDIKEKMLAPLNRPPNS